LDTMKKGPSRLARTVRSLLFMISLGAGLAIYNSVTLAKDVSTATGAKSDAQHNFFVAAADRPDIELFYKKLTHDQKVAMAKHLGEYQDPKLAKVIGKLVGTFDAEARGILTDSLTKAAQGHPEAVASLLTQKGSLQIVAITAALRSMGPDALPSVVDQLKVADARTNSVAYLVAAGKPAAPFLLPKLDDTNKDVRLAAADALGKIGDEAAIGKLTDLYTGSTGDEKFGYLSALSGIGARQSEGLLTAAVTDESLTGPRRAQAMLGLGRIGSNTAIQKLWALSSTDDPQVLDSVVSALQLAGDQALSGAPDPHLALRVAGGLRDRTADEYISKALTDPALTIAAAEAAAQRPSLVGALAANVKVHAADGAEVDALMRALSTSREGQQELQRLANDPLVGGFAFRRLKLVDAG